MATPNINKILREHRVSCRYGAPMGSRSILEHPELPLYLQRIRFVDGDYSADGTYWGGYPSEPLWCAFGVDSGDRIFVRAMSRRQAKIAVTTDFPAATFIH